MSHAHAHAHARLIWAMHPFSPRAHLAAKFMYTYMYVHVARNSTGPWLVCFVILAASSTVHASEQTFFPLIFSTSTTSTCSRRRRWCSIVHWTGLQQLDRLRVVRFSWISYHLFIHSSGVQDRTSIISIRVSRNLQRVKEQIIGAGLM
jgi:hypothetical protein